MAQFIFKDNKGNVLKPVSMETIVISDPIEKEDLTIMELNTSIVINSKWQLKDLIHIAGITNNYIRSHGGKPIRRVPERFL